jgi:TolB-like protein/tetratricopeptide (TPR) repeat protein
MFTDIAGYTPLAQKDEKAALQLLREQQSLVGPVIGAHRGRQVKSMGDGLLIEFPNALDAVECGVDLQRHVHERNALPGLPQLRLRVGIHLGDVQEVGADIFGDAVNIASRIEPLADPGGVCLSEPVFVQVRNKVPYQLENLGSKTLKGVEEPVAVYRVALPWMVERPPTQTSPLPRIAVLPFVNISPDPKDEYFADGLTEELITVLSQFQGLQVIARTSVTPYKSTSKPLTQIGAELGVATVLGGSVRKAGNQLRITAQLINVSSQGHLWANTYDRKLDDIFAVQTEVAERIADVLRVKIGKTEEELLGARPTTHPDSYLAYLQGRTLLNAGWSEENFRAAKKQFELAATIDPKNARAFSGLADATTYLGWGGYITSREEWLPASRAYAAHAVELDQNLAEGHCSLGMILWDDWDFTGAERELKRALALNPSYAAAHHSYGGLLFDEGRVDEGSRELELSVVLDPQSRRSLQYYAIQLCVLSQPETARPIIERIRTLAPESADYHYSLGIYYDARSDLPSALREFERAIRLDPEANQVPVAWVRALMGEREAARQILESEKRRTGRPPSRWSLAAVYALIGDFDEAYRILFKAAEEHDLPLQRIRNDPRFEPLRRDPRFAELLKKMNLA